MRPEDVIKMMEKYHQNLEALASGAHVAVGLTKEEASRRIYKGGMNVVEVGASHEYGAGVPQRSFLRTPFYLKRKEIEKAQDAQHKAIFEKGSSIEKALGIIGIIAVNISKGAFTTKGYGKWRDISASTKAQKGSSQPLIDTGILRSSITFDVRS